ncbi:MAG: hypothetical protein J6D25_01635 [Eggerthellaceae bacterium]|nr:hypothetical protein [Eggerthellaceae bacterium]
MSIASSLAKIALAATTNGKDAVKVIEAAGTVVAAANVLLEQAKPLMENVDTKAIADSLKASATTAAKGASSAAKEAGNAVASTTEEAANKVGTLFSKLGDAKGELAESLAQAKGEKELKRAIRDARQSVLENATTDITVADLAKAKQKAGDSGFGPISTLPGCFVIATYKKLDFDKDLTDYIGLYIGKADHAAEGVDKAMSREGDPDVYADVKYKQNVRIFVYNCMPEELDSLYESLSQTFSDVAD